LQEQKHRVDYWEQTYKVESDNAQKAIKILAEIKQGPGSVEQIAKAEEFERWTSAITAVAKSRHKQALKKLELLKELLSES
jgi:hypothetical protein